MNVFVSPCRRLNGVIEKLGMLKHGDLPQAKSYYGVPALAPLVQHVKYDKNNSMQQYKFLVFTIEKT